MVPEVPGVDGLEARRLGAADCASETVRPYPEVVGGSGGAGGGGGGATYRVGWDEVDETGMLSALL